MIRKVFVTCVTYYYFVLGSPFIAHVEGDLPLVSGSSLTSAPVSSTSHFTMSNVSGSLDDIEVNVEGKLNRVIIINLECFHSITFASARLFGISIKACLQVCVSIFLQVGDITNLDYTDTSIF